MQRTGHAGVGRTMTRWGAGTLLALSLVGGVSVGASAAQGDFTLPPTATATAPDDITLPEPEPTSTPPILTNPDPQPTATAPDDITNPDPEPTAPDDKTGPNGDSDGGSDDPSGGTGGDAPGVNALPKTGVGAANARDSEEEFGMPTILLASGAVISIAGIAVRGQRARRIGH